MVNYYEVLEVSTSASQEEIKKNYHKLAKKYHPDRGAGENEKIKEANEAYGVLSDPRKRKAYDTHGDNWKEYFVDEEEMFTCAKLGCGKKFRKGEGGKKMIEGSRERYFCSQKHLNDYQDWVKKGTSGSCRSCGSNHESTGVPPKCEEVLSGFSELALLSCWEFFTLDEQIEYKEEIKNARVFHYGLDECRKEIKKILKRAEKKNKEKENEIDQKRNQYIQQLKDLDGWKNGLLSEKYKEEMMLDIERSRTTEDFQEILERVKKKIKELLGKGPDASKNLQPEIQKAIQEIEAELNKEPKIIEVNEEWRNYIENSSNLTELKSRKQEILEKILTLREQGGNGNLTELCTYTIHLIKKKLEENSISDSELTNPNWENEIKQARTKSAVLSIKNQVLANIKNIKASHEKKNLLQELLAYAKQKENWDNYLNLENILKQIKELRSTNAYQEKVAEIQALENRLRELDPSQFKKSSQDLLDQQVKDNGLTDNNMDDETKKAIAEAKQNPTEENITKAEEKIAQNGADNNLNNLITKISNKLEKGNLTEKEKKELESELLKYIITENKYQQAAYQKLKSRADALLAKLKGEKNNQETPPIPWPKILGIATLIALPLIIIVLIILRARRRKLNRETNY